MSPFAGQQYRPHYGVTNKTQKAKAKKAKAREACKSIEFQVAELSSRAYGAGVWGHSDDWCTLWDPWCSAAFLFVCLFVGSQTPEAVEASPYYGWDLRCPKALGPQEQADAVLFVRRIPTPPLVGAVPVGGCYT